MGVDKAKTPSKSSSKKGAQTEKKAPRPDSAGLVKSVQSEKKAPKPDAAGLVKSVQMEKKAPKPGATPKKSALTEKKRARPDAAAPMSASAPSPAPKPAATAAVAAKSSGGGGGPSSSKSVGGKRGGPSEGLQAVLAQHSMNKLNTDLASRALTALLQYTAKVEAGARKPDLLADGEKVHMQVTLKRVPPAPSNKPIAVPVPHPPRGAGAGCSVCLFVKGEDKPWVKELLLDGAGGPLSGVAKIVTLEKLRTSYARFEQRRDLLATYDMFMCDDRILPMMTQALGKTFLDRKKQPVAVKVARKESLPLQIAKLRDATYMFLSAGTCVSVCVGTTAMPHAELLANVAAAVPAVVDKLPRKWKAVQAIALKTTSSVSLPVLNKLPFVVGQSPAADGDSDDDSDADSDGAAASASAHGKGLGKAAATKKGDKKGGKVGPSTMAAVKAAARAAKAEAAAEADEDDEAGAPVAEAAAGGGNKRRGGFDRKQKAAPAQNSKLRRSPSPAQTRAKKAKAAK